MNPAPDNSKQVSDLIKLALLEDVRSGDITTDAIYSGNEFASAEFVAKQDGILAGLEIVAEVAALVDTRIMISPLLHDGSRVSPGDIIAQISGPANSLLTAERTMLNFLQRMSGIASRVREFADAVKHTSAVILDTRKTLPGHRITDKMAVVTGGGQNHRFGLYDRYLIKENHITVAGGISKAISACITHRTRHNSSAEIEIEVNTLEQLREVLQYPEVTYIMLDNMSPEMMRKAVSVNNGLKKLEASGNVGLYNVAEIAETGVDFISIGSVTHSVSALDISLMFKS